MKEFEHLITSTCAHAGLTYKLQAYRNEEITELLREIIALANAVVSDPRLIVVGADHQPGLTATIAGISENSIAKMQSAVPAIAARAIEPGLSISVESQEIRGKRVGFISISGCEDPPYLLKCDLSKSMPAGRGWIRRGPTTDSLRRSDLDAIFGAKNLGPNVDDHPAGVYRTFFADVSAGDVHIGFSGNPLTQAIELDALPLDELPSSAAAAKLKKLLASRKQARDFMGRTVTQIQRLLRAQVLDPDAGYQEQSDESLAEQLLATKTTYHDADRHYEYNVRTHALDMTVSNTSKSFLPHVVLSLSLRAVEGVGISDQLYGEAALDEWQRRAYPAVTVNSGMITVTSSAASIAAGESIKVFRQPPRLWVREAAAGRTLELKYSLDSKVLAEPIAGTLRIHIRTTQESDRAKRTTAKHEYGRLTRRI